MVRTIVMYDRYVSSELRDASEYRIFSDVVLLYAEYSYVIGSAIVLAANANASHRRAS